MRARAKSALDRRLDPLLAMAVLGLGLLEIWLERGQVAGPRGLNTVFLLLIAVPLAWRRRRPVAVLAVVTVGVIGGNYALYLPGDDQPPLAPFIALLLAVFAAAAAESRRSMAVGALVAAWIVTEIPALVVGGQAVGNIVPAWI